ncbi:DNA mismatch repair protein MutT [Bacillus manliponensis]|uniref:DNA mismatch repair protein MutT n=1 Tax=Bacillus manliponensis TaxID=574376 RepID=A0A073K0N9_9BACI|nr:NUDIX domain-containing protein [Bacillus manliponensis]KEK19997.1 DNA mismatch repair protein MutT [Bacillus manliponensis]
MTTLYKKKVYAYITREKDGLMQLLVHTHRDIPEAGVQVPGGTVDEGETLEGAVLREVFEESGLRDLFIERFVGDCIMYVKEKQEYQKRHFFHMTLLQNTNDSWDHTVSAGEEDEGLVFSYKWIDIEKCPSLIARQDEFLHVVEGMRV